MYTVYKVTNKINSKFYIGVHKTNNLDDGYLGSGSAVKAAIKMYGKENFVKEIVFITENKHEAYEKEKQLTVDFMSFDNYNMCIGGVGGFTRENALKGYKSSLEKLTKQKLSENGKKGYDIGLKSQDHKSNGKLGGQKNKGKPKSEEHKQNIRDAWIKKKLMANSSIGGTFCS